MDGDRESSPVGDAAALPRASRRPNRFLLLGAALVTCAVLVAALFLGGSFPAGPASSTAPVSFQPSPSSVDTAQAAVTATPVVSGPIISGMVRFDSRSGLIFLSDGRGDYLRTTGDGGSTWSELRPMPSGGPRFAAEFIDVDHGWRAYDLTVPANAKGPASLTVARTTDGGKTWHDAGITFASGIQEPLSAWADVRLHFRDRSNGVLMIAYTDADTMHFWPMYYCGELTTSDGGATWSAPRTGRCLALPTFVSDLVGYAGIYDESLWSSWDAPAAMAMTVDGGRTWNDARFPTDWISAGLPNSILFMQRRSDGTLRALCACGLREPLADSLFLNPSVISSSDDGRTWTLIGVSRGFGTTSDWVGAAGEDRWLARAAPMNTLEVSDDGGLRWQQLAPVGMLDGDVPANASMWSNGWLLASTITCPTLGNLDCVATSARLYATDDGGITVRPIPVP